MDTLTFQLCSRRLAKSNSGWLLIMGIGEQDNQ